MKDNQRFVVAVSGGVDSVVLLDMLATLQLVIPNSHSPYGEPNPNPQFIVAHFDHGIRQDSHEDAALVSELAKKYGLLYETQREELGASASEDLARTRRYLFLRDVAKRHGATITTAHHADDIVETIAINMTRGTGWRGLAALDSDIVRPLLHMTKQEIIAYAKQHKLTWHEDSTNASDAYLRNRLRRKIQKVPDDDKWQVRALRARQTEIKHEIDREVKSLVGEGPEYSRYFFGHVDYKTAMECLRYAVASRLTRPQCERALLAIKTAKVGNLYEAGNGVNFRFTSRHFSIELVK